MPRAVRSWTAAPPARTATACASYGRGEVAQLLLAPLLLVGEVAQHHCRLGAVAYFKLGQNAAHMMFDGLFVEIELQSDALVAQPVGHQSEDLTLTRAEIGKRAGLRGGRQRRQQP